MTKGSRGESRPLQITITKSGFETKRLEALEAQRALYETLKALRTAGEALEKSSNEAREQFERLPDGDAQRRTVATGAGTLGETFTQQLAAAWAQLLATLKIAERGHTTADLVQVGRLLSRIDATYLQVAKDAQGIVSANPDTPMARELMREFAENNARAVQRALPRKRSAAAIPGGSQVIAELLSVVHANGAGRGEAFQAPGRGQRQAATTRKISGGRPAARRSFRARSVEQIMKATAGYGGGDRLKQAVQRMEKERTAVERSLAGGEPGAAMIEPMQRLSRSTRENVRVGFEMVRDQSQQAVDAHTRILRDVLPTYSVFEAAAGTPAVERRGEAAR